MNFINNIFGILNEFTFLYLLYSKFDFNTAQTFKIKKEEIQSFQKMLLNISTC